MITLIQALVEKAFEGQTPPADYKRNIVAYLAVKAGGVSDRGVGATLGISRGELVTLKQQIESRRETNLRYDNWLVGMLLKVSSLTCISPHPTKELER